MAASWHVRARELREQGLKLREIAKIVGRSRSVVGKFLEGTPSVRGGFMIEPVRELYFSGMPLPDIAKQTGLNISTVRRYTQDLRSKAYVDWRIEARRLRTEEGKSTRQIAKIVRRGQTSVRKALVGLPIPERFTIAWHEDAKRLRQCGFSLDNIAKAVHKSKQHVGEVVKGIPSPINHRNFHHLTPEDRRKGVETKKSRRRPVPWHAEARERRAQGESIADLAAHFHVNQDQVRRVVKGVVCPVNFQIIAARQNLAKALVRRKEIAASRPPRARVRKPKQFREAQPRAPRVRQQKLTLDQVKKRNVGQPKWLAQLTADRTNRKPPPVTLPRLTFLED
jgi:transposase/DNA-binding transcriptional MerR regulator